MMLLVAQGIAGIFALISLIHLYWALGGKTGSDAAVPQVPGKSGGELKPAFKPSALGTLLVAVALLVIAVLVCLRAGVFLPVVTSETLQWSLTAIALVMFLRAIGDFKAVGFFKRIGGSKFARLDSWAFSPLCVVLGLGLLIIAWF